MSFDVKRARRQPGEAWSTLVRTLATHRGRSLDRALCRDIGKGFDFDRVMLLVVDEDQRMLVPRAAWRPGLSGSVRTALATLLRTPLEAGEDEVLPVTSAAAVRQQQIFVPDATNPLLDDGVAQRAAIVRVLGTTGYVATPIVHRRRTLGVLVVDRVDRPIHEADRTALRDVAALLALHLSAHVVTGRLDADAKSDSRGDDVLDALDDGVLLVEHDGTICYSNAAAARRFGMQRQDLVGQVLEEVLQTGAPELAEAIAAFADVDEHGLPVPNGTEWNAEAGVRRVLLADGRRAWVLAPRRRLSPVPDEGALRMLVHDLKAPMQSVLGFAELLQLGRAGELHADQRVFVDHIIRNGETLLTLIGRILEHRGGARTSRSGRPIDVRSAVEHVAGCMVGKAFTAGVHIDVEVSAAAPSVTIDWLEFHEVVQNLVDNAIQAAPAGGRVILRAMPCGGSLCIEVAPAQPDRAGVHHTQPFDLLRQAPPETDRRRRAPHLGLRIVREIAERNRGEVWAEPAANGGLAFKFTLPADPVGPTVECA